MVYSCCSAIRSFERKRRYGADRKKGIQYRFVSVHCHDTGGIPFDGYHCGGMVQKLTRKDAAEFSFFLAVPTMFAATGYKVLKLFLDGGTEILVNNMPALIIG